MITVRRAVEQDAAFIARVYNEAVADGKCTCDTHMVTGESRRAWLAGHGDAYPVLIAESEGQSVGYGYLSEYRFGRERVRSTAEVSYYVDFACHRRGVGTALLARLIQQARSLGYSRLVAILMEANGPSIGLLKKHGFEKWGAVPSGVDLGQARCDHVYYGLIL